MNAKNLIQHFSLLTYALLSLQVSAQEYGWTDRTVEEASPMKASANADWWVSSGAYFYIEKGIGHTILGKLPEDDRWRREYASSNPEDTENGYKPQNIFRLVTRKKWKNFSQEMYFQIVAINTTKSENRDGHNAVLFFNRYQDKNNLYYAGIRADGRPVIEKKVDSKYFKLAIPRSIFPGTYDREKMPNLIPTGKWIGMKTIVESTPDLKVRVLLYLDLESTGTWKLVAETEDDGKAWGKPITEDGFVGIRTDFMDVEFRGYKITVLNR